MSIQFLDTGKSTKIITSDREYSCPYGSLEYKKTGSNSIEVYYFKVFLFAFNIIQVTSPTYTNIDDLIEKLQNIDDVSGNSGFSGSYDDLSSKPEFKTINSQNIIGTGNIAISGGGSDIKKLVIHEEFNFLNQSPYFNPNDVQPYPNILNPNISAVKAKNNIYGLGTGLSGQLRGGLSNNSTIRTDVNSKNFLTTSLVFIDTISIDPMTTRIGFFGQNFYLFGVNVNYIFFEINPERTQVSLVCRRNSETRVNLPFTNNNSITKFKIEVISNTSVLFYIDDILVGTITTNIPPFSNSGTNKCFTGILLTRPSATGAYTSSIIAIDYITLEIDIQNRI